MIGPVPPQIGGLETFMADLLASDLSQSVELVHFDNSKPAVNRRSRYTVPDGYAASFRRNVFLSVISYTYSAWFFLKFIFLLLFQRFDIVHIHTVDYTSFWEKCAFILAAKCRGPGVVLHVHAARFDAFYRDSSPRVQSWIRYFLQRCDRILVLSSSWQKFFSAVIPARKVCIVPNGIDLTPFQHVAPAPQRAVLFLGEISARKGIDDFLHAIAEIQQQGHDFCYHIIGPGEIDRAKKMAARLGLKPHYTFWGPKTGAEKVGLLRSGSCLVLPSYAEGLPISILEAFACGLPVISTRVGGIPEMITGGENGFLLQPGDVTKMAEFIVRVMTDAPLYRRLSANNLKLAREIYDINAAARRIVRVYAQMLDGM